jgi:hypothetical protein
MLYRAPIQRRQATRKRAALSVQPSAKPSVKLANSAKRKPVLARPPTMCHWPVANALRLRHLWCAKLSGKKRLA